MPVLALALALTAAAGSASASGGELRLALYDLDGDATPDDRAAASALLVQALTHRGFAVARTGRPPVDCGAPCLDRLAAKTGADLLLTGALSSSNGGHSLSVTLFDARRVDAPVTRGVARGVDLNALGASLSGALDALLGPALALRGLGPDSIRHGLGWGTPGLIVGGALTVAGGMSFLGGAWPFVDRALAATELARLRAEGGAEADLAGAERRLALAHQSIAGWGMSALALGTGATLVGAAMISASAPE